MSQDQSLVARCLSGDETAWEELVRIDWKKPDPEIDLEIHTGQGNLGLRKQLTLSQLKK